jgi:hypothetical protein
MLSAMQSAEPSILDQARARIRAAKLKSIKSEEATYYYDVAQKRSFYCEEATSCFDRSSTKMERPTSGSTALR